jgi:hypothetical protein
MPHWWSRPRVVARQAADTRRLLDGILQSALRGNPKGVAMLAEELGPLAGDLGRVFPALKPLVNLLDRAAARSKPAEGGKEQPGMTRRAFVATTGGAAAAAPSIPKMLAKTALDQLRLKLDQIAPGLPMRLEEGTVQAYRYKGDTEESGWSFVRKGGKVDPESEKYYRESGMEPAGPPQPAVRVSAYSGRDSGLDETFRGSAEDLARQKLGDWRSFHEEPREPWEVGGLKGQLSDVYEDALRSVSEMLTTSREQARTKNLRNAWLHIVRRMDDLKKHPEKLQQPVVAPKTETPPSLSRREMAERIAAAVRGSKPEAKQIPLSEPPPSAARKFLGEQRGPFGKAGEFWRDEAGTQTWGEVPGRVRELVGAARRVRFPGGFFAKPGGELVPLDEMARHWNAPAAGGNVLRKGWVRGRGANIEIHSLQAADPRALRAALQEAARYGKEVHVDTATSSAVYDAADLQQADWSLERLRPMQRFWRDERGEFTPGEVPAAVRAAWEKTKAAFEKLRASREGYGPYTEMVATKDLARFAEVDRTRDEKYPGHFAEVRDSIAEKGIYSPAILKYNPDTKRAYLGEGNTRVAAAKALGLPAVPVRVYRSRVESEHVPGVVVRGIEGRAPEDMRPSQIGMRPYREAVATEPPPTRRLFGSERGSFSFKPSVRIDKMWLAPDGEVHQVPDRSTHWEVAERMVPKSRDPVSGLIGKGWIRVNGNNLQAKSAHERGMQQAIDSAVAAAEAAEMPFIVVDIGPDTAIIPTHQKITPGNLPQLLKRYLPGRYNPNDPYGSKEE